MPMRSYNRLGTFASFVSVVVLSMILTPRHVHGIFSTPTNAIVRQTIFPAPLHSTTEIFSLDPLHVWALVDDGKQPDVIIVETEDGGKSWKKIAVQPGVYKVFFLSPLLGWALRVIPAVQGVQSPESVCLMGTADGGRTWSRLATLTDRGAPSTDLPLDMLFVDQSHGWIVGQRTAGAGIFLETKDGGMSFATVKSSFKNDQILEHILSDSNGHICILGNGTILASSDNGKSWQIQLPTKRTIDEKVSGQLWGGWMFSAGHWLATGVGKDGEILSTVDYGGHWKVVVDGLGTESTGPHVVTDISFFDSDHGCASLDWSLLVCTSDAGKRWATRIVERKTSGDGSFDGDSFKRIVLLPNGIGWLLSDHGFLYQTKDHGQTWSEIDLLKALPIS